MNTNTGWAAFTNQKKENEGLKKQLIVQDANKNGIRLIIDEKDNFKNVISEETQFRFDTRNITTGDTRNITTMEARNITMNLDTIVKNLSKNVVSKEIKNVVKNDFVNKVVKNEVKEEEDDDDIILETTLQDIENEIANLQKQLVISKEIKRQKELLKAEQNKKIEAVKAEINDKTEKFNLEMLELNKKLIELQENKNIVPMQQIIDGIEIEEDKKEDKKAEPTIEDKKEQKEEPIKEPTIEDKQTAKKRRPLHEVIKRPTKFKTTIKGIEFLSFTEDGHKIIGNGQSFGTLNKWLEYAISTICKGTKTSKSVFEVVYYYNLEKKEWRQLKTDYTSETTRLN